MSGTVRDMWIADSETTLLRTGTLMKRLIAPALAAALLMPFAGSAQTSVTANAGWSSNYFYRGVPQKSSSASAGLDVEGPMVCPSESGAPMWVRETRSISMAGTDSTSAT